jgi:hypothetical protein
MFRSRCRCVGQPRAWGWSPGTPVRDFLVETTGSPMFLGNPDCAFALLSDPGGPTTSGRCDAAARPPF